MKKYLILAILVGVAATASAQSSSFSQRVTKQRAAKQQVVTPGARPVGAVPRTGGNPIQMLNPMAPARYYGPPEETVVPQPYPRDGYEKQREGAHYTGLILFGWRF